MRNMSDLLNIRLRKVKLTNFRNIEYAEVDIPGGRLCDYLAGESSLLGLYGQNGSGKTSLLLAIQALKDALSGRNFLYMNYSNCIRFGCKSARLGFVFSAYEDNGTTYDLSYSFTLSAKHSDLSERLLHAKTGSAEERLIGALIDNLGADTAVGNMILCDELLQVALQSADGEKLNKQVLINTSKEACDQSKRPFGNRKKYEMLTDNCSEEEKEMLHRGKIESELKSTSYIFNRDVITILVNGSTNRTYSKILKSLSVYGDKRLFVMFAAPIRHLYKNQVVLWNDTHGIFNIPGSWDWGLTNNEVAEEDYLSVCRSWRKLGKVVAAIIPGMSLSINDRGSVTSQHRERIHRFELMSVRNGVEIPIVYESEGIKRMFSFLSLLIAAYNYPFYTVCIDELDSGIYEYMVGEIVSIMNESAKGQLVFTSHNLRPLEVLPNKNLLFTTVNPQKRFTKLEGISGNNNLRDSYYRNIVLGAGKDAYYDGTDTFVIERSLLEAGLPEDL